MARLNVELLVAPISAEAPSGPNLEYDPDFAELERVSKRVPEQEYGKTKIPAVEPNWPDVKRLSTDLLQRTKDLRIAVYLAQATLRTDGIPGLCDALHVIRSLVEQFWDSVYPQLDPDDDNDPTLRVNCLATLSDAGSMIFPLQSLHIVRSRKAGKFSRRDVGVATGEIPAPERPETPPPDLKLIEAAFEDCDLEELKADALSSDEAAGHVRAIDLVVTRAVGAGNMRSIQPLAKEFESIHKILVERLERRGVSLNEPPPADPEPTAPQATDGAVAGAAAVAVGAAVPVGPPVLVVNWDADITCREDAIKALERVCKYFEKYEPSSPLPLLLRRAKRLSTKSFLEILRDISPDGLGQAEALGGHE